MLLQWNVHFQKKVVENKENLVEICRESSEMEFIIKKKTGLTTQTPSTKKLEYPITFILLRYFLQ